MAKKDSFLVNRLKSVVFAYKGFIRLLKTEASFKVEFFIAILVTMAGFYYQISDIEWIVQCLAIGLVMSMEAVNTAIEEVANFIHPERHKKIGLIKDLAAGAVFIAAVIAIFIGFIIYYPKVF